MNFKIRFLGYLAVVSNVSAIDINAPEEFCLGFVEFNTKDLAQSGNSIQIRQIGKID